MSIISRDVIYHDGTVECRGYFAIDEQQNGLRPVMMIVPDWRGRSEHVCEKAKLLATLGCASFVVDMYGAARQGNNNDECTALIAPFMQDRTKLATRILAAFNAVQKTTRS